MKSITVFLTTFAVVLLLCACSEETPTETVTAAETTIPEATSQTEFIEQSPVFSGYEYRYKEDRNRAWEEDIVYLAKCYLGELIPSARHPLLVNREVFHQIYEKDRVVMETACFYDQEVHDAFCQEIFNLIGEVPQLSDQDIQWRLQKAVALLNDEHANVYPPADARFFTLLLKPLYAEDGRGLYATLVPKEHEALLYRKLTAINGVPTEEIIKRLSAFIPRQNDLDPTLSICQDQLICNLSALQAIGVCGRDAESADFTFLNRAGEQVAVTMTALSIPEAEGADVENGTFRRRKVSRYREPVSKNYWWEYLPDSEALYIRINRFQEDTGLRVAAFLDQLRDRITSETKQVILDVRSNPGGKFDTFYPDFLDFFKELQGPEIFVLTDNASLSAAALLPAAIFRDIPKAKLVGEQPAQPPQGFGAQTAGETPRFHVHFEVSAIYYSLPGPWEEEALIPDMEVHQTLEDYVNGVDTVLEAVMDRPRG